VGGVGLLVVVGVGVGLGEGVGVVVVVRDGVDCGGAVGVTEGVGVGEGLGLVVVGGGDGVAVGEGAGDGVGVVQVGGGCSSQAGKTSKKQVSSMVRVSSLFICKAMVALSGEIVNIGKLRVCGMWLRQLRGRWWLINPTGR